MLRDPEVANNLVLAIIALANLATAYLAYRNHGAIKGVKEDVATVEKATNSMKDALIAGAGREGETKGFAEGKAEGDRQAALDRISEAKRRDE